MGLAWTELLHLAWAVVGFTFSPGKHRGAHSGRGLACRLPVGLPIIADPNGKKHHILEHTELGSEAIRLSCLEDKELSVERDRS
jgi:hypothetical protein